METATQNISVLNDLIQINTDRITGYQKAIDELKGERADLSAIYGRMAAQSRDLKMELEAAVGEYDGDTKSDRTIAGAIYQTWMDVRTAFSADKQLSTLDLCEFGEDAAQNAYKKALDSDGVTSDVRQLISRQKDELLRSHDEIKALRDAEKDAK